MMTSFYNLLKYAATGIASPDMTYYDRMRASTLMGGAVQTLTGIPPLTFKADGTPLISWSMKGNGQQTGTPTPDNPVMPTFCGTLDGTDWKIPISCGGQTVPVYLGQTQTVRKIRKLVLTGEETFNYNSSNHTFYFILNNAYYTGSVRTTPLYCSHYIHIDDGRAFANMPNNSIYIASFGTYTGAYIYSTDYADLTEFTAYIQQQYAAGTPVTVWYVLANDQTGIVNEPLAKIGDYCDELHSEDAGVSIPTVKGQNTLTVDTTLQPSEMSITYKG